MSHLYYKLINIQLYNINQTSALKFWQKILTILQLSFGAYHQLAFDNSTSTAKVTLIKSTKQQLVCYKGRQWSDLGPMIVLHTKLLCSAYYNKNMFKQWPPAPPPSHLPPSHPQKWRKGILGMRNKTIKPKPFSGSGYVSSLCLWWTFSNHSPNDGLLLLLSTR